MPKAIFDPSKPSPYAINWNNIEKRIVHLQCRISRAKQQGHTRLVRNLQRLLVRSLSAQLLAAKQLEHRTTNQLLQQTESLELTPEFLTKYFLFCDRKDSQNSEKIKNFYNLKLIQSPNYKKVLTRLWNLALLPAVIPTSYRKIRRFTYKYKYSNSQQLLKIQHELRNTNNDWFIKVDAKNILSKTTLGWIEKHTPIEKSLLKGLIKDSCFIEKLNKISKTPIRTEPNIMETLERHVLSLIESFLSSRLTDKANEKILPYQNGLLILGSNENTLNLLGTELCEFLDLKNSDISRSNHLSEGLEIDNWRFQKQGNMIFTTIVKKSLKNYRKYLKSIIKLTPNTSRMIETLNELNRRWSKQYQGTLGFRKKLSDLNKYIFDQLWHWARKKHSSKGNIWIFHKYWKKIQNKWTFIYTKNQHLYSLRRFSTSLAKN